MKGGVTYLGAGLTKLSPFGIHGCKVAPQFSERVIYHLFDGTERMILGQSSSRVLADTAQGIHPLEVVPQHYGAIDKIVRTRAFLFIGIFTREI
jgi:hypothetical protein